MTGWTVLLRGMRYRAGRSLVVLILAAIAVTAAVLTPAYEKAARQSVLTDSLRDAPAYSTSLTVSAVGPVNSPAGEPLPDSTLVGDQAFGHRPLIKSLISRPTAAVDTPASLKIGSDTWGFRYVYRQGACKLLKVTGACPSDTGQIIVSDRAAKAHNWAVGQKLSIELGAGTPQVREIVGTYTPRDPVGSEWGAHVYFTEGVIADPNSVEKKGYPTDAMFAGAEEDVKAVPSATLNMEIVYPVAVGSVKLDDVAALRDQIASASVDIAGGDLALNTQLPGILDEVSHDQAEISRTIPVVAVPLLLLVVGVLMMLVATLTEERSPEIALAKLRGYPAGRASRFGLGEVLLLITLATPIGLAAGLGAAELAARTVLAPGVHVDVTDTLPLAAAGAALIAAFVAAWAASRRTVQSGVLSLLRRVPHRTGWRASAGEGIAVALAAAALVAAWQDRSSPLALLAAPLFAIVAGIIVGRLLRVFSAVRLRLARHRGNVATMLAAAQLARRPGRHRVVMVVTIALALLGFAATAWDVSAQARSTQASLTLGAARVYTVNATDTQALIAAVRQAAPDGSAMPVVRRSERYADDLVSVVGVPADQLGKVATWPGHSSAELTELGTKLRPKAGEQVKVSGRLTAHVTVHQLGSALLQLEVLIARPGQTPLYTSLGHLQKGTHDYTGTVPEGRFVGLALVRDAADGGRAQVSMDVESLRSDGSEPDVGDPSLWQPVRDDGITVNADGSLKLDVDATGNADFVVSYLDTPAALPVALAGEAPDDDRHAKTFTFLAFAEDPQKFAVVRTADGLPRAGVHGMLVDLDYALRRADATTGPTDGTRMISEVWANSAAPADLPQRLAAAGVTVTRTQTIEGLDEQLGRRAPALAWRLYLLAGVVAAALALALVLLVARLGAAARRHEFAALRVTGVKAKVLRRGVRREHMALIGLPILAGFVVGVGSAVLMLPGFPLVTVGEVSPVKWTPTIGALAGAAVAGLLCLIVALVVAVRLVRRAAPELLRGDV
ncbi:FtsX-like permease family protein [Hamadaea tsunoensis]|uniref:FtsX-like permease family protein n=1 Tax=Hamadaea tsunoensis TaxID=53368 RepID=UPI0003FA248E|nr:FtsX-like permease family protein [Hamadaea tsunoensis]